MNPQTELERQLAACNAVLTRQKNHKVYRLPNGTNFVVPKTPSDYRTAMNNLHAFKRAMTQDAAADHKLEPVAPTSQPEPEPEHPGPTTPGMPIPPTPEGQLLGTFARVASQRLAEKRIELEAARALVTTLEAQIKKLEGFAEYAALMNLSYQDVAEFLGTAPAVPEPTPEPAPAQTASRVTAHGKNPKGALRTLLLELHRRTGKLRMSAEQIKTEAQQSGLHVELAQLYSVCWREQHYEKHPLFRYEGKHIIFSVTASGGTRA